MYNLITGIYDHQKGGNSFLNQTNLLSLRLNVVKVPVQHVSYDHDDDISHFFLFFCNRNEVTAIKSVLFRTLLFTRLFTSQFYCQYID